MMFSVESAVRQVKPDFILQHVLEAEEIHWSKVHLDSSELETSIGPHSNISSVSSDSSDPGAILLKHGTSVRKIHKYFSQLEFRKCCLHLAGRKSTAQSLRVVLSNSTLDDGSAQRRTTPTYVTHLEDKELRAFKHAYLCAAYPVLAAPDPPSPFSPVPVNPTTQPPSVPQVGDVQRTVSGATRAVTPYSVHDSGLEDSEDLAFVPAESICAHLQRAFRLTDEKFRDYRYLINRTYVKKSAQKLLAEQLAGQLAVLENNCHPFYRPQDFCPPTGYDIWRKAERNHITELIGKFWHYSLPFPCNSQDLISELHSVHDDYRILLKKLLAYEQEFQRQTEEEGGSVSSFLSSASVRLLKEFGLRYGIGEQFRKILYLEQMSLDFSPSLMYIRHMLSVLNSISDLLPANKRTLSMVQREHEMLQSSLVRLSVQASKALEQMKSLFPGNKPAGSVEMLIMLLQRVRDIQLYLVTPVQHLPPLEMTLRGIVQGMFFQTYEKCKTVIRTELRQSRDLHVCPRLLNALIMEMRDEVLDLKNNFDITFNQYFDITVMAAKAFYALLMNDVKMLCEQEQLRDTAIDLRMLALVHRLNQLDRDWSTYITSQDQTWRHSFQHHVKQWGHALLIHVQDLTLEVISGDAFITQQLQLPAGTSLRSTSSSSSSPARSVSIAPSINSAFSIASTPRQGSSLSNRNASKSPSGSVDRTSQPSRGAGNTSDDSHNAQPTSDEKPEDFLSFADGRRYCASMPTFMDRPAMVRAMSDLQMLKEARRSSLRSVPNVEDLRASGYLPASSLRNTVGGKTGTKRLDTITPGSSEEQVQGDQGQQKETETHILDSVGDVDDEEDDNFMGIMSPAYPPPIVQDEDLFDYDDDDRFSFPPLQEVTDQNVTHPTVAGGLGAQQEDSRRGSVPKPTFVVGNLSLTGPPSSEDEMPTKIQTMRTTPTNTAFRPHSSHMGLPTKIVHPHLSRSLPIHQASPFRKISPGSTSTYSEVHSEREQPFLQSIHSTISFPSPTRCREVIIPVSGSAVDVVVMLQRVLAFGRAVCTTVFPPHHHLDGDVGDSEAPVLEVGLEAFENSVHLNIVETLCKGLSVYADNMLCLDLCAVPKEIARRVIGTMLVEHAVQQQRQGRIWGCRHQLEGLQTCFAFHNRNAIFLCDRYEPITQKMCVRINNVSACQHYLDWCSKQTQPACFHLSRSVSGQSVNTPPPADQTETIRTYRPRPGTSTEGPQPAVDEESKDDINSSKQQCIEETRMHLKAIWNALCRLLAFRINLFLGDGLILLLSLKPESLPVEMGLQPVIAFLRSHLDALSSWLYASSFRRVIEYLWIYIVQDIENEVSNLSKNPKSKVTPHVLLQTLNFLMKFMNNCEQGITRELMLAQADSVSTKLQLLTLVTVNLIALYFRLQDMWSEENHTINPENYRDSVRTPTRALHQLRHDLQTRYKCFSGAQLIRWIRHHSDLFMSPDELSLCRGRVMMSVQGAQDIAQLLLDNQYIVDVEMESSSLYSGQNSVGIPHEYPEVSIHSERNTGNAEHSDDHGSVDTDVTPTPTPRPSGLQTQRSQQQVVAEVHEDHSFAPLPEADATQATGRASREEEVNEQAEVLHDAEGVDAYNKNAVSDSAVGPVHKEGIDTERRNSPQLQVPSAKIGEEKVSARESSDVQPQREILAAEKSNQHDDKSSQNQSDIAEPLVAEELKTGPRLTAPESVGRFSPIGAKSTESVGQFSSIEPSPQLSGGLIGAKLAGEEVMQVAHAVGHDTGPAIHTGFVSVKGNTKKPLDTASDFEDSGVGEVLDSGSSEPVILRSPNASSVRIPASAEATLPQRTENSSTPVAQTPTHRYTPTAQTPTNTYTPLAQTPTHTHTPTHTPTPYSENQNHGTGMYDADHSSFQSSPTSSVRSLTPFTNCGALFDDSPTRFYFMPSSTFKPNKANTHQPSKPILTGEFSLLNHSIMMLRYSQETSSLAEKCFNMKITPLSVLGIIYRRRRQDKIAQNFLQGLPAQTVEEVRHNMAAKSAECSVL